MVYTKSMSEFLSAKSLDTIDFPRRTNLIKQLRYASFIINDILILGSLVVLIAWVINFPSFNFFLFQKLAIVPSSAVLFMLSGLPLFFGAKRHLTYDKDPKTNYPWWNTWIPVSLAALTFVGGLIQMLQLPLGIMSFFHTSSFVGLCFCLIGLSLIPPFTRIPHRFHITQFLIFIVCGLSMLTVLEDIYQLFSPVPLQHMLAIHLPLALTLALYSLGILFRWSNRGFIGNFTLDSTGSIFGLRVVIINLLSIPLIAFIVIALMHKTSYNSYQTLSVIIVILSFISSLLIWVNVKLLYKYSLEHLLMRESLRAHNIDLVADKERLQKQMMQVEEEKEKYADKLNMQKAWRDVVDTSS